MGTILLVDQKKIVGIDESPFGTEDEVKDLLEKLIRSQYQNVLPDYTSDKPPAVIREFRTPAGIADFLVVDLESGKLYLIEAKNDSNYRVAIGQLLDYAAGLNSMSILEILRSLDHSVENYSEIISKFETSNLIMIVAMPEIGDGLKSILE